MVQVDFTEGRKLLKAKDYQGAFDFFTKVIKDNPDNAKAYWGRAKTRRHLGGQTPAWDIKKAHELDPSNMLYAKWHGIFLGKDGYDDEALALLEFVNTNDPGDKEVLFGLALVNAHMCRQEAADQYFEQLKELCPEYAAKCQFEYDKAVILAPTN